MLVLLSALTGLPPFYLMTLVAGALKMNFPIYLGGHGRTARPVRSPRHHSTPGAISFIAEQERDETMRT